MGKFYQNDTSSIDPAFIVSNLGKGKAGLFHVADNNANVQPALYAYHEGKGSAAKFEIVDESPAVNTEPALEAKTNGSGSAGLFSNTNATNSAPVVAVTQAGTGHGISEIQQNLRQAAHTNAADADEVHPTYAARPLRRHARGIGLGRRLEVLQWLRHGPPPDRRRPRRARPRGGPARARGAPSR